MMKRYAATSSGVELNEYGHHVLPIESVVLVKVDTVDKGPIDDGCIPAVVVEVNETTGMHRVAVNGGVLDTMYKAGNLTLQTLQTANMYPGLPEALTGWTGMPRIGVR
jgi:hypothetical protein